jgi:RNA polymerase sigma-70 factor (ECF subfamily)
MAEVLPFEANRMQAYPLDRGEFRADMEDLVRRAQEGDRAAFEALYRQQVGRVYALCRRMAGDPQRAEELTQEAFIRAWERLETYRPGTRFGAWLSKVAVNVVLSDRRSRGRRSRREYPVDDPDHWDPPSGRSSPNARMDLEQAIAGLPDGARNVFVLHDVEGYRHEEIGRALGLATGTSKSQLHRARRLLREALTR